MEESNIWWVSLSTLLTGQVMRGSKTLCFWFQVYLTIKGTRARLPKQQLSRNKISAKTKKKLKFKFARGSLNVFKMSGKDIGDVASINIEVCLTFIVHLVVKFCIDTIFSESDRD